MKKTILVALLALVALTTANGAGPIPTCPLPKKPNCSWLQEPSFSGPIPVCDPTVNKHCTL